jgi:hypothetical protein
MKIEGRIEKKKKRARRKRRFQYIEEEQEPERVEEEDSDDEEVKIYNIGTNKAKRFKGEKEIVESSYSAIDGPNEQEIAETPQLVLNQASSYLSLAVKNLST